MKSGSVWLVGTGLMGREYARVLAARGIEPVCIGRSAENAAAFGKATGMPAHGGGLAGFLSGRPAVAEHAIVCVGVEALAAVSLELLSYGVPRLLVEKPGALEQGEIDALAAESQRPGREVYIAYNRRFYEAARAARDVIAADGGVTSFQFDFTEWSHKIAPLEKPRNVKSRWFIANSSHVVDLAFFLGGRPSALHAEVAGSSEWHPAAMRFSGSGRTEGGALFSYLADWGAPGRWGVELMTPSHRLVLRPLEELQVFDKGSLVPRLLSPSSAESQDGLKPGLRTQTASFLEGSREGLCTAVEQAAILPLYRRMAGYDA